ncbi:MAG TPA: translocase [Polyangia bacterium]|nr:translocase [Polyangia bacterium]
MNTLALQQNPRLPAVTSMPALQPAREVPALSSRLPGGRWFDLPGLLARALSPFARVERGEAAGVLLMAATVFLLLTAYYLLKIAREPLILLGGGAEVKSYASAGQALLLILVVKGFTTLSQRVGRLRLVTLVTLFFVANLVIFFVLGRLGFPLGIPFYLWVGVFSVTAIGQFWSLANDLVTPEQGKRLFAVVGIGSSLGAVFGARVARVLFGVVGLWGLMLAAAVILLGSLGLTALASRAFERQAPSAPVRAPLARAGGFALLGRDRYLQLIALLVVILNLVNTTGEYVLDRSLLSSVAGQPAAAGAAAIAIFKARYFQWVNIASVALQLFAVSRVMRYLGMRVALLVLPLVALGGYGLMAFVPLLSIAFATKVAENSVDYSLQNTARQALFLPTSREAKYQAKVAIDTFLVRGGDVLSALVVWLGIHLHAQLRTFALLNVAFAATWILLAWRLAARHARVAAAAAA